MLTSWYSSSVGEDERSGGAAANARFLLVHVHEPGCSCLQSPHSPPFTIFQDTLRSFPDKESPDPWSDSLQDLVLLKWKLEVLRTGTQRVHFLISQTVCSVNNVCVGECVTHSVWWLPCLSLSRSLFQVESTTLAWPWTVGWLRLLHGSFIPPGTTWSICPHPISERESTAGCSMKTGLPLWHRRRPELYAALINWDFLLWY